MLSRQAKERPETVDKGAGESTAWGHRDPPRKKVGLNVGQRRLPDAKDLPGVRTDGAGSGRLTDVAMVQATDFGDLNDPAAFWRLNRPPVWCILIEREVSSGPVIVRDVAGQDAAQVLFTKDEDVIGTLAPDRADEALREGVLPRAVRRRQDFRDPQALHSLSERVTVGAVAIAE